jgi:hypothetical protein
MLSIVLLNVVMLSVVVSQWYKFQTLLAFVWVETPKNLHCNLTMKSHG